MPEFDLGPTHVGFLVKKSGIWTGFYPNTSVFLCGATAQLVSGPAHC